MFKAITWSNYGTFIIITLAVYYVTIGCLYYLNEIKQVLSGKSNLLLRLNGSKKLKLNSSHSKAGNSNDDGIGEEDFSISSSTIKSADDMHSIVSRCMNDIEHLLANAAQNNLIKPELIYSIQQLTSKYSSIQNSPFKSFITNYILIECDNYCSIHLDEDELRLIWAR